MTAGARRAGRSTTAQADSGSNSRTALASQAEIRKLARILHREPDGLAYLEQVSPDDLRVLREQTTDVLFSASERALMRLAAASKVLPAGVTATIAQRAFGPLLAARIAGLLEPSRAVEVAAKLPPAFLADVAIELDPRRAIDVIARIPPQQIAAITEVLVAREEYVTMGRFVGHLPDPAIKAALEVIDDRALLRTGFVLEQPSRLDHVIGLLASERFEGLIDAATGGDLWPEALELLSHLSKRRQRMLVETAVDKGDTVLESLVTAAERDGMWDAVLQLESSISERSRKRFTSFVEQHHPELRAKLDLGRWT